MNIARITAACAKQGRSRLSGRPATLAGTLEVSSRRLAPEYSPSEPWIYPLRDGCVTIRVYYNEERG